MKEVKGEVTELFWETLDEKWIPDNVENSKQLNN